MYIEPNSDIMLFKGVKIDKDYQNTLYFASQQAQETYFNSLTHTTLTKYYYQRKDRGYIRVGLPYVDVYNVNYMAFKNTSTGSVAFEHKWFYAFVDSVEYINDGVTELHYTLDVMQTWLRDFTLEECFVERQHSISDDIGGNLVPEEITPSDYVYNNYNRLTDALETQGHPTLNELLVVFALADRDYSGISAGVYNGVLGGVAYYGFPLRGDTQQHLLDDVAKIGDFVDEFYSAPNAIVCGFMSPKWLLVGSQSWPDTNLPTDASGHFRGYRLPYNDQLLGNNLTVNLRVMGFSGQVDGYTVKNNKLLSYPYNMIQLDNAQGNVARYRFEYFNTAFPGDSNRYHIPSFRVGGCGVMPVTVRVAPVYYKGCETTPLNNESIILTNYPMVSWNVDTFKAWLAQNAVPIAIKAASDLLPISTMGGGVSANIGKTFFSVGGGWMQVNEVGHQQENAFQNAQMNTGALKNDIVNAINSGYQAAIAADMVQGTISNGNANLAMDCQDIYYGRISCRAEEARRIDDYFTMFGYADKSVHVPNIHARQKWTYVKTIGCEIYGHIPGDDKEKIQSIFNSGVRFWTNGDEIGLYYLTNAPLS